MENGVKQGVAASERAAVATARDALGAILLAETAMVQRIDAGEAGAAFLRSGPGAAFLRSGAFGEPIALEAMEPGALPAERVRRALEHAALGERVALVASSADLSLARSAMAEIAAQRLSIVFHAVESRGAEAAFALADLGWGLLFASDVEESFDLSLVARRASEDSGTPIVVVHELAQVRHVEPLSPPDPAFIEAFIGPPSARVRRLTDPGHPAHAQIGARGFAERVPFALGSAFRELETLTGRKRDLVTRVSSAAQALGGNTSDAPLVMVGLGQLGDVLLGEVARLRAAGHDVAAVKLTAFRPFPGPRIVRLLSRAMAITVIECRDEPLAQSNPVTREMKAAFADALTWAPEYPGIGRIPRIHSGVVHPRLHDIEAHDLDAVVRNMLEGDLGKRFFSLGAGSADASVSLERSALDLRVRPRPDAAFHMRGVLRDAAMATVAAEVVSAVIASVLSLRARASSRGVVFDLVASPERPQGVILPQVLSLIVLDDVASLIQGNPLARLGNGGTVAVASTRRTPEALWSDLPPYVKAIVFDRRAHVVGWEPLAVPNDAATPWMVAATFAGLALAVAGAGPQVDASLVERGVVDAVRCAPDGEEHAVRAGKVARAAFEAHLAIPRSIVEGDLESVRLGRKDARAADVA